jgi:hypothetical protein
MDENGQIGGFFEELKKFSQQALASLSNLSGEAYELNKQILEANTTLAGTFGRTQSAVQGLRKELVIALPEVVRLGGNLSDVINIQDTISKNLGTNRILLGETTSDLFVAMKALGQTDYGAVVGSFQDAGIQVGLIKDRMQETANIARLVGVNSSKVFDLVSQNLSKLNEFGFKNGVEGLSRMAAKAAVMRFDMYQVFTFAEKVFSPEGAIEAVSAFQRLGVAVGDLADPFRLMYLASEDVEGLTDQVVQMTSKFTFFDEKSKEFKVFPYAKRDLRDIATTMGISYENLVKMSMAQTKLNQISSEFKFSGFDKDDQQLIANFAQFSKEKNAFIVKVDGKEKLIAELGKKDVEALRGRPETLEEIGQAPLTETELLIAAIKSLRDTFAGVSAGSKMTQDLTQAVRASIEATNVAPRTLTTGMRGGLERADTTYENFPKLIKEMYQDLSSGNFDLTKYTKKLTDASEGYVNDLEKLGKKIQSFDFTGEISKRISGDNLIAKGVDFGVNLTEVLIGKVDNIFVDPLRQSVSNATTQLSNINTTTVNNNLNNLGTQSSKTAAELGNLQSTIKNKSTVISQPTNISSAPPIIPQNIQTMVVTTPPGSTNQNVSFSPITGGIELKVVTQDGRSLDVTNQIVNSSEFQRKVVELISERMNQPTYSNLPNSTRTT